MHNIRLELEANKFCKTVGRILGYQKCELKRVIFVDITCR